MIARWQLVGDGLCSRQIESIVDAGLLRPIPGRVFTTARSPLPGDARRWAAVLSGGPKARLTSVSVLALNGIREQEPDDVHVVVPGSAARPCPGVRRYRTAHLPVEDQTRWNGLPGVTIARALVDAAADSSTQQLCDDLDRAVMLGLYDAAAIDRACDVRPRLIGRARLAAAIATLDEHSGRFLSAFERRTMRLLQTSSVLPPAAVNVLVRGFRPDFLFAGTHAIVECDGRDYHRSPAQIAADHRREERLRALGYEILRVRWSQVVYEPEATLARIERFVLSHLGPPTPRR